MPATFSRIKDWIAEDLTPADLNAEFNNILNNLDPTGIGDYSVNAAQMRLQTDPGGLNSENLATSEGGELERLRYVIKRLIGSSVTYWYQAPPSSISDLVNSFGPGLPANRISSGQISSGSSQMIALIPTAGTGTAAAVVLVGATTPMVYFVQGNPYTISTNITVSGLSLAPSTNNTALFNMAGAAAQQYTKFLGQYGTSIQLTAAGTGIAALVGAMAGFKCGTEYFTSFVQSTSALTNAWRGTLFNSASTAIPAVGFTTGDTVTLMRLTWLFATTAGAVAAVYTNPTIAGAQPTSPATGDYWFDTNTTAWKTFNSVTWNTAAATLIGYCMQDTASCVAARTLDAYIAPSDINTCDLEYVSGTQVRGKSPYAMVSVFGQMTRFLDTKPIWDLTQNMEVGISATPSTYAYLYMKQNGVPLITNKAPIKRNDLLGLYHPSETWRCLGNAHLNASTQFEVPIRSFLSSTSEKLPMGEWPGYVDIGNTTANAVLNGGIQSSSQTSLTFPTNVNRFQISTPDPNNPPGALAFGATGAWVSVATLSLTPGLWKMNALLPVVQLNGTPAMLNVKMAIDPNTTAPVLIAGYNYNTYNVAPAALQNITAATLHPMTIGNYFAQVTASTNYKLSIRADGITIGLTPVGWFFMAERQEDTIGSPS